MPANIVEKPKNQSCVQQNNNSNRINSNNNHRAI